MAVSIDEVLMGLGGFHADFDWSPDLAELLKEYNHLRFRWGEELIATGVILAPDAGRSGIIADGRLLEWYLGGADSTGPLIVDREFIAGTNKLSNPLTPESIAALGGLYWRFAEGTYWVLTANGVFHANPDPSFGDNDDVLPSDDPGPTEVRPGEFYTAQAAVLAHAATFGGRIRVRQVYEGRFAYPDLAQPYASWPASVRGDIVTDTDPLGVITGDVMRIHSGADNLVPNPSFEDGLTSWLDGAGTWTVQSADPPWHGTNYVSTSGGPGYKWLQSSASGNTTPVVAYAAVEGEEYQLDLAVRCSPSGGTPDGEAWLDVGYIDATFAVIAREDTVKLKADDNSGTDQRVLTLKLTIPEGVIGFVPSFVVEGQTTGQWDFDMLTVRRTKGNIDTRTGPGFVVVPKRSYTWSPPFRSDQLGVTGTAQLRLVCHAADRPIVVLQGPTLQDTEGAEQTVDWSFESPSGYDFVQSQIYTADVAGGSYYLGRGKITDNDPTTQVRDGLSPPASSMYGGGTVTSYGPVPAGAERMHVEVIAENLAGQWSVGNVSVQRVAVAPSTSGDVVRALLVDPVTGSQLLAPGTINGPELIVHDWRIRNLTCRDAMAQLSRAGVALPYREWRVRPIEEAPGGACDWATPAELFADRSEFVFAEGDFFLGSELRQAVNVEDAANVVRIIGAERVTSGGSRLLIEAEAANALAGAVDGNGVPLHRVSLVEDSTVDHIAYAASRARYEADAKAGKRSNLPITLHDWRAMGRFSVGDWLYFYNREAGLEDLSIEAPLPDGRTVNPVRKRVASRRWELGAGTFRLEVYNPATGDVVEIDNKAVKWSDKTVASLELGDLLPTFTSHAQGGAVGNQFLRYRASSGR